jgi:hypothetical protein
MRRTLLLAYILVAACGCSSTSGTPMNESQLGYSDCVGYFDCGSGRFCNEDGRCWSECRTSADCREYCDQGRCNLTGDRCDSDGDCDAQADFICNRYGQCLEPDGGKRCSAHADCGPGRFCNGVCALSGAHCGGEEVCPYGEAAGDVCKGRCGAHCGNDNDCRESCIDGACSLTGDQCELDDDCTELKDENCTPVGQCLEKGWEKWIPPGELPPTACSRDAQCKGLGFSFVCDCEKQADPKTGLQVCTGGLKSVCVEGPAIDFGDGPAASSAHAFRGVWGMRMEIGVVTVGLPLVTKQNTYSSNLFLVKISHNQDDTLELEEKVCEIQLINFIDSDEPFDDLAWVLIPNFYLHSLPLVTQSVRVASANPGDPFETTQSVEVRGCVLADPLNDPLPDRFDFDADPDDPRFIDQDEDGHVAMTTYMDGVLRGEIYNVQRWKGTYHGIILDADHIRGLSTIENEQLVISASKQSLVYDTMTEIHAQADRTYFRLMRMDDDTTCADLIREGHLNTSWLRHTPHMMDVPDP